MNRLVSALVLKVASDKVRQIKSVRSISKDFFIYHVTLSRYCKKLAKPQRTRFKTAASVYSTIINSTIIKCDSVNIMCIMMMSYYLIVVEGFACPNDPRSSVVGGFYAPGRVSNGKRVRGEGPDKG